MVTSPADIDPCPGCGGTSGVQPITGTPPRDSGVVVHDVPGELGDHHRQPQPYFDRLAAAVEQLSAPRSILRQVITLADDATTQGQIWSIRSGALRPRPAAG